MIRAISLIGFNDLGFLWGTRRARLPTLWWLRFWWFNWSGTATTWPRLSSRFNCYTVRFEQLFTFKSSLFCTRQTLLRRCLRRLFLKKIKEMIALETVFISISFYDWNFRPIFPNKSIKIELECELMHHSEQTTNSARKTTTKHFCFLFAFYGDATICEQFHDRFRREIRREWFSLE